MNVFEELVVFF